MKRISLLLAICIYPAFIWGLTGLSIADSAIDANRSAEQHFEKAVELLRQEDHKAAIAEYEKVIKLVPRSKIAQDAEYWIGQSYFRMGQYEKALSTFEKLVKDYPESAIVPVTQLMISRVQQEKDNNKMKARNNAASDDGVIIDPATGVKYTKTKILTGKSDVIQINTGLNLSPNGRFLLWNNLVVPLDGSEPFDLVDTNACRGTWSPDGKKVVFYAGAIWVIPVSIDTGRVTGPAKKLLDGEYLYQSNVSWSPDSGRIAFERTDKEIHGDIWTLSIGDGSLLQITNDPEREYYPSWSPDGKSIAYGKAYRGIWLSSAEGGTRSEIIDVGRKVYPFWTPDSKWIFYDLGRKLKFISLTGKREFDITIPNAVGDFFSWSPDGKKMLFYRPSYDDRSSLKVVSTSGGPSLELGRQLTLWPVEIWSPDSKAIITSGESKDGDVVFWIVPLAGGDPFPLETDVSVAGKLVPCSVSPDVKKLAFVVRRDDGTADLWVSPISVKEGRTTGPAVKVFDGWYRQGGPSWSPDGTKLAIIHEEEIWIAFADGSKPVQITKTPGGYRWLAWSPNGKMIAFYPTSGEATLYVIPASGGGATKVLDACNAYAWSHDSKSFAVLSRGSISVIPIARGIKKPYISFDQNFLLKKSLKGKSRHIIDLKELDVDDAWGLCWSPDARYLAFISRRKAEDKPYRIFIVPVEGGKATELAADDSGYKYFLCWSPNSKWIAYNSDGSVKTRPEGAIWEADVTELLSGGKSEQGR